MYVFVDPGLFFCLLCLSSSLGCVSAPHRNNRGRRKILNHSALLTSSRPVTSAATSLPSTAIPSWHIPDTDSTAFACPSITPSLGQSSSARTRGPSLNPFDEDTEDTPLNRASPSRVSYSGDRSSLPGWVIESSSQDEEGGDARLLRSSSVAGVRGDLILASGSLNVESALCRSYGDTSDSHLPLIMSHPSSSSFPEFILSKISLLILFLLIVTLQNVLTYPLVVNRLLKTDMDMEEEQIFYSFVSIFLVPMRLFWIVLIGKVRMKCSSLSLLGGGGSLVCIITQLSCSHIYIGHITNCEQFEICALHEFSLPANCFSITCESGNPFLSPISLLFTI
jgi:hypothetical protein